MSDFKANLRAQTIFAALAGCTALTVPAISFAQDMVSNEAGYQEIIVTAQRREEKLQQVPLAITAVTGDDLRARGAADLKGLSQVAPSLNVMSYPNSSDTLSLNMRGQGVADAGQITKDGGVGLYFDGFYISRPQAALLDLGSPDRVEVLRGPQGTLYGRNTTGGAVNIITRKPSGEWGGEASLTVGSRDMMRGFASVDLPAVGNLALRGTLIYFDQDGWVKNPGAVNNFHKQGQLAGRIAARWTPVSTLTVDYAFNRGRVTSTQPYYFNPDLVGVVPGYTSGIDSTHEATDIGLSRAHFTDHQLTINWDVADTLTLRSLSSYRKSDAHQDINYGFGQSYPFPGFTFTTKQQHQYRAKQYTQEFQVVGSIGDLVEYTGGLYYFKEDASHWQTQQIDLPPVLGGYLETTRDVAAISISKAAYLQATIIPPVLENRLKLTLGGRYTEDERRATRSSWFFAFKYEDAVKNDQKFHNFSPSVNLAMQWTPDVMTYARWSRGYKAGGSAESAANFALGTYGPEKVEAWELGFKSQFFDRAVTLNASAFWNKFSDMQVDFTTDPVDLTQVSTVNAGRAEIKGIEAELMIRPRREFGLQVSYAYLDPQLKEIKAVAGTNFDPAVNPSSPAGLGDDVSQYFALPFVPKHSLTVSGDWRVVETDNSKLTAFASYSFQDRMFTSSVAGPATVGRNFWRNDARKVVNARLVLEQKLSPATVSIAVFANNLFDHRSRDFVIGIGSQLDGYISQTAPWSEPRTIGVELKTKF